MRPFRKEGHGVASYMALAKSKHARRAAGAVGAAILVSITLIFLPRGSGGYVKGAAKNLRNTREAVVGQIPGYMCRCRGQQFHCPSVRAGRKFSFCQPISQLPHDVEPMGPGPPPPPARPKVKLVAKPTKSMIDELAIIRKRSAPVRALLIELARETRYRQCRAIPVFNRTELKRTLTNAQGLMTGSAPLPCRRQSLVAPEEPCCQQEVSFRLNSTDFHVYEHIFLRHLLKFCYGPFFHPRYILDAGGAQVWHSSSALCMHMSSQTDVALVVPAGANAGFSSLLFKLLFPNATVISVEPDISNFDALSRNTAG